MADRVDELIAARDQLPESHVPTLAELTHPHHPRGGAICGENLTAEPVDVATARLPAAMGGLPAASGFYAWWLTDEMVLPSVPTSAYPTQRTLRLVYIGIAPKNEASAKTIRSRVLTDHLGLALGSSTLRRGLCVFLWEEHGWHPCMMPSGKPNIWPEERAALTRWMETHLRVSWCLAAQPWNSEADLIGEMQPPLNSDHNHSHPFYPTLRDARKRMMAVASETST